MHCTIVTKNGGEEVEMREPEQAEGREKNVHDHEHDRFYVSALAPGSPGYA